jgi:hypothetical protein
MIPVVDPIIVEKLQAAADEFIAKSQRKAQ